MEEIKQSVAKNLTELRRASGMTQLELAERLNYSDKAVSKWERGDSLPDVAVLKQIAENAGLDGAVILAKVRESGKTGYGFDAYREVYCDMMDAGIVDPAKVPRSALQNAASVASMVLTTESLVADKPEKNPAVPAAPAGGMDGMY